MNNLLTLPNLKKSGLTAAQALLVPCLIAFNQLMVAATPPSKPKPKPGPIPGEGRPRFVEDTKTEDLQTEDSQTKNLIIAGVKVRVKGEPTRPNDGERRSYEIKQEKV